MRKVPTIITTTTKGTNTITIIHSLSIFNIIFCFFSISRANLLLFYVYFQHKQNRVLSRYTRAEGFCKRPSVHLVLSTCLLTDWLCHYLFAQRSVLPCKHVQTHMSCVHHAQLPDACTALSQCLDLALHQCIHDRIIKPGASKTNKQMSDKCKIWFTVGALACKTQKRKRRIHGSQFQRTGEFSEQLGAMNSPGNNAHVVIVWGIQLVAVLKIRWTP